MPPLLVLLSSLVLNYIQHKRGKPTICSFTRERIPTPAFFVGLITFLSWFVPHWVGPKLRKGN